MQRCLPCRSALTPGVESVPSSHPATAVHDHPFVFPTPSGFGAHYVLLKFSLFAILMSSTSADMLWHYFFKKKKKHENTPNHPKKDGALISSTVSGYILTLLSARTDSSLSSSHHTLHLRRVFQSDLGVILCTLGNTMKNGKCFLVEKGKKNPFQT